MKVSINDGHPFTKLTVSLTSAPLSDWQRLLRLEIAAEIRDDDGEVIIMVYNNHGKLCYLVATSSSMINSWVAIPVEWLQQPLSAAIEQAIRLGAKFAGEPAENGGEPAENKGEPAENSKTGDKSAGCLKLETNLQDVEADSDSDSEEGTNLAPKDDPGVVGLITGAIVGLSL